MCGRQKVKNLLQKEGQIRHSIPEIMCEQIIKTQNEIIPVINQNLFKKYYISNNLHGTEDDYLFIDQSDCDDEYETEFNDVPEGITEDEHNELFMLFNNESS